MFGRRLSHFYLDTFCILYQVYCIAHVLFTGIYTSSGFGKRETHKNWFMVITEKVAPVTGATLRFTGPVPADSRQ